jgi:hypothetical protein
MSYSALIILSSANIISSYLEPFKGVPNFIEKVWHAILLDKVRFYSWTMLYRKINTISMNITFVFQKLNDIFGTLC